VLVNSGNFKRAFVSIGPRTLLAMFLWLFGSKLVGDDSLEESFEAYKRLSQSAEAANPEILSAIQQLWSVAKEKEGQVDVATVESLANKNFSYLGVPINPMIVREFLPWVSDKYPSIMSIDIGASQFSNKYFSGQQPSYGEDGYFTFRDTGDGSTFGYKWLGLLANGIHVVKVFENTTGSAVFSHVVLVSFQLKPIQIPSARTQLLMLNEGVVGIGDRTPSTIKLEPENNKIQLELKFGTEVEIRTIDLSLVGYTDPQ
jgi:hypothetical protein